MFAQVIKIFQDSFSIPDLYGVYLKKIRAVRAEERVERSEELGIYL